MKKMHNCFLGSLSFPLLLISISVLLMGTDACREDYYFAAQSTVASPTVTPDDDDVTTRTPTVTPTATSTNEGDEVDDDEETPEPTPTAAADKIRVKAISAGDDTLLGALGGLGNRDSDRAVTQAGIDKKLETSNWLGRAFQDESDKEEEGVQDYDAAPPAPLGVLQK